MELPLLWRASGGWMLLCPCWRVLSPDPGAGLLLRSRAVDTLGRHEATRSLLRMATLTSLDPSLRERVAVHLETLGYGAQAVNTLSVLLEDDRVDTSVRERAVSDLGHGTETDALREIVDNKFMEGWIRATRRRPFCARRRSCWCYSRTPGDCPGRVPG